MIVFWIVIWVLLAASLLSAAVLLAVAVRGSSGLPSELDEKPMSSEIAPADLPQSAAGGLAAGEAVDA